LARLVLENLTKHLGGRTVIDRLNMEIKSGEMVCLLGPSGSGKTTTLRMIGGFISPDAGRILIDDQDVSPLPPERRPTAMVFQQYALWPHMDVFHNVSFGLRLRRTPRNVIRQKVQQVLEMVGLEQFVHSYPGQLSGGQQQRVALARALVLEPKLLLLDEPLSNLDAKLRLKMRDDIRDIQQRAGITTVFVTHDQDEALSISDRVAVLLDGKIEQFDSPNNLYRSPKTKFIANFIGSMNMWQGRVTTNGVLVHGAGTSNVFVPCGSRPAFDHRDVEVAVRPEDVRISMGGVGPTGTVVRRIPRGHYDEVVLQATFGEVRSFVPSGLQLEGEVHFTFERALIYHGGRLVEGPELVEKTI
jgi:ABC-type Fe3+/spermidine/putrescine transport system ATPase subunit